MGFRVSEPKNWMTLAAVGAAIAGLVARMRHRSDPLSLPARIGTPQAAPATNASAPISAREARAERATHNPALAIRVST